MAKRSSNRKKKDHDFAVTAFRVVEEAVSENDEPNEAPEPTIDEAKNPAAVELGRLGGKKGGPARAKKLTPEQRRKIAKKGAAARWASTKPQP